MLVSDFLFGAQYLRPNQLKSKNESALRQHNCTDGELAQIIKLRSPNYTQSVLSIKMKSALKNSFTVQSIVPHMYTTYHRVPSVFSVLSWPVQRQEECK